VSGGLILITGGVRSGKSRLAERLAGERGDRVTYIATMEALDDEVRERIRVHRNRRPPHWVTVEAPCAVAEAIAERGPTSDAIVVDCLGLLVSNILLRQPAEMPYAERCAEVLERVRQIAEVAAKVPATVIVVSNEVGWGVVPESLLGRLFRDAMGWCNQILAASAGRVFLTVAGIPVDLRALGGRYPLSGEGLL